MNNHSKGFWQFFVRNYRFTTIVVLACVLMGLISMALIRKESNPDINVPIGVVSAAFPGANARDTEELVTNPIEDKVLSLSNIDVVTSTSGRGISSVVVQFDAKSDTKEQIANLKDKIDEVKASLPEDVTDPVVRQISFNDRSIFTFALSGPYSTPQLKNFAEELKEKLERVSGVSEVRILGGQEEEIQVIADKIKIDEFGLSLSQLTNAIRQANTDIPAGSIEQNNENLAIRFKGRISSAEEIKNIPIIAQGASVIFVRDVAEVKDGYGESTSISRLSSNGNEALPSVSLQIYKTDNGDIGTISAKAQEIIENEKIELPENITFEIIENWGEIINKDLTKLRDNGLQTVIIIMILLFFFVGWREAILAGISIPLTFFITFTVLYSIGYTLNFLSLFSLILALGILVDATIVITEGMYNEISKGSTPREAAYKTIDEFKLPLISGTLTTVFAFLPMLMTSGIMGEFIKSIPVTVSIVLMAALFVGLAVVTSFGARFLKAKNTNKDQEAHNRFIRSLRKIYEEQIEIFIKNKWKRRGLFFSLILLFFLSFSLPVMGILEVNMFPAENEDTFYIDIENPVGTVLEQTDKDLKLIETELAQDKRIKSFLISAGSSSDAGSGSTLSSNVGNIVVKVAKDSPDGSIKMVSEYSEKFKNIVNANVSASQQSSGPGDSAPVEVVIDGKELETLESIATDIKTMLKEIPGTRDVKNSVRESNGEIALSINLTKAQYYGVTTAQIAGILRNAITGTKATTIRNNGDNIDVIVKYNLNPEEGKTNQTNIAIVNALTVATPKGDIPLNEFLNTSYESNRSAISHKDGKRIISVTSKTNENTSAQEVFNKLQEKLNSYSLPDGYNIQMGGEREDINQSLTDMARAMILAIFLIGALLVWQFKSYRQPIFVLMTIPLALTGVFPGLVMVNLPLSFPAIIGVVALAGIVVNNAIILVDRINENRVNGSSKEEAIIEAGKSRLQPILLTTITTVMGILPLAMGDGTWGPLGFSIIFGLMFSTVLTLIVIPLLYFSFGEKEIER